MTKTMIGRVCFIAALAATVVFAKQNEERGCESESHSDRRGKNAVVFWNEVAGHSIADLGGRGPPLGSVEAAIVHTAIYDAVNAICGYQFTPYAVTPEVRRPALTDAAVAAAAHHVLVALYPDQQEELDQKYAEFLEAIPGHHRAKLNGIAAGQQTAAVIFLSTGHRNYLTGCNSCTSRHNYSSGEINPRSNMAGRAKNTISIRFQSRTKWSRWIFSRSRRGC